MKKITDLTKKQELAFLNLQKAYNDCNKAGIIFVNRLNTIIAYNSKYVSGSTDDRFDGDVMDDNVNRDVFCFSADIDQWVDCIVYLKLTDLGKRIYKQDKR